MSEDKNATDQSYYDEHYFVKGDKKIVDKNTGQEKVWGYQGTDWSGHYYIVQGLLAVFNGEIGSLLDVGAGQGSCTDYALRAGLNAKGYDFSDWAVKNALNYSKGNLFQGSATDIEEKDESWDLVYCSDMIEHIKQSEISKVFEEFHRITRKWVFLQWPVCKPEEAFDFEKADEKHPLYSHFMIAGHLNMQPRTWWDSLFEDKGFVVRNDLVKPFRESAPPAVLANWLNIAFLEKRNK